MVSSRKKKSSAKSKVTIYGLAEQLGVSASTVSRALSGAAGMSDETRRRVLEAATAANYSPNFNAQTLRTGRAQLIEIVSAPAATRRQHLSDPFFLELLAMVADELTEHQHDVLITQQIPWQLSEERDRRRCDGLIVIGQGQEHEAINEYAKKQSNLVVWGAAMPDSNYVTVGSDNPLGGRMATEYLISLGHRRIAFIGDVSEPEVKLRLQGYQRALARAGLVAEPGLQFGAPFDIDRAAIAARAAIATAPPFDAVVCATDVIALNVIVALNAAGKRVPEDVSVVGYDDIALASSLGQALTTVSQNVAVGGRILVSLLLNILDNRPAESTTIAPELKVRSTCRAR